MSEQVTIYALVDEGGAVHYVGQTRNAELRRRQHYRLRPALTMTVLAEVEPKQADEAETAASRARTRWQQ